MSTNFNWTPAADSPLACFGELHIGKRSGGWSFSFQAYDFEGCKAHDKWLEVGSNLGIKVPVPELPSLSLKSFEDWKVLLTQPGSTIIDEYGTTVSADDFLNEVQTHLHPLKGKWGPKGQQRPLLNQVDELMKLSDSGYSFDSFRDWKDSEGYSFSLNDFS
jgi:hypothetical protein